MEGIWLGNGDPTIVFAPDLLPLTAEEAEEVVARMAWLREELLALVAPLSPEQRAAKPERGRSIDGILAHVYEPEPAYVRQALGRVEGLRATLREGEDPVPMLRASLPVLAARLRALTDEERVRVVQRGQERWTARKAARRLLEHAWEHLVEIQKRLK